MKQLLVKIAPKFLINILIKRKYKKENISKHIQNLQNSNIVEIQCDNIEKYDLLKIMLYKSFAGLIKINNYKLYFHPVAIIKTPINIEEYLKNIGAKSRNMNKKAEKNGIKCSVFDWNEKLDDIYEINTSSKNRQGRQMDEAYRKYPETFVEQNENDFKVVHIGGFIEDKLVGYIELYIYGNFIMTNRILGHKDYLKFGVMNLLFKRSVEYAIEYDIEYINYLSMQNRKNNPLSGFKYRVGFREYSLLELK